jgi:hypothetical protein
MSETASTILDRIREFERTFKQKYGREMNDEELTLLHATREIIQQRLRVGSPESTA